MVQQGKEAVASAMSDETPQSRHDDPIEGRLSIRRWYDLSSSLSGLLAEPFANGLDSRRFIEAVLWMAATDSTWPQLPKSYGNFHVVYQRFVRWTTLDVWGVIYARLHGDNRLFALQRLVQQEQDIQHRRAGKPAQATQYMADADAASMESLHALEARIETLETMLRALLDRHPNAAGIASDGH